MAIIQTIRDKYAKVAGAIIILALVGFVLTDLGKSGFQSSTTAAEVNGEEIDIMDYNDVANKRVQQIKSQQQMQGGITDVQEEQIRDEVWNSMVADIMLSDIYDKMGMEVSDDEFMDMFTGVNPDPNATAAFTDPSTGQYDAAQALQTIQQIQGSNDPAQKQMWEGFKAELTKARLAKKVGTFIAAGMVTPKAVLDAQSKLSNTLANIEMVQIPFSMVSDDKVTVTDAEITDYINNNKSAYTHKFPSLELDVVKIPYVPSVQDSTIFFAQMDSLKQKFAEATNNDEFVIANSSQSIPAQTVTKTMADQMPNGSQLIEGGVGSVVGPFDMQGQYAIAKILEKSSVPDSVEVRHILVTVRGMDGQAKRDSATAKSLIDSIATAIKSGASFDTLVTQFSEDQGSIANKGKYTFTAEQKGSLTKAFGDFAFSGANGESKVVYVDQERGYTGFHYVEIIKKAATSQSVSKVQYVFAPFGISDDTKTMLSNMANQFLLEASKGGDNFDKEAVRLGLAKIPVMASPNSKVINGVGISPELIKWANKANTGDVSTVFLVDGNYVIAKLKNKNERGALMTNNQQVKDEVMSILKRKKKAQILLGEYDAKGDINAIATALSTSPTMVDSITFNRAANPVISGEPAILGAIYNPNLAVGQSSKGIVGKNGIYYIKLNSKTPQQDPTRNAMAERNMNRMMYKNSAYTQFTNAKLVSGDINDYRYKFIGTGM